MHFVRWDLTVLRALRVTFSLYAFEAFNRGDRTGLTEFAETGDYRS